MRSNPKWRIEQKTKHLGKIYHFIMPQDLVQADEKAET